METISQSPSTPSDKPRTISERLAAVAKTSFIGRQKELSLLVQAAIGNTSPKVNRYVMDCREIQPEGNGLDRFPLCTVYLVVDEKTALVEGYRQYFNRSK